MRNPTMSLLALAALLLATTAQAETQRRSVMVTTGDVTIETFVEGAGPAIVMLPSSGRDGSEDFDSVAADLAAAGFTVLRPQPRGMLGSTGPMQGISLHQLAGDVVTVIDKLGNGRAVIVGHAFGHFVARMAAVDHPQAVRGVVLAAAAASVWPADIAATPLKAGDLALPEAERLAALRLGFFAPGHDPRPWLHGWWPAAQKMETDSREKAGVGILRRPRQDRGHPRRQPRPVPRTAEGRGRRRHRLGEEPAAVTHPPHSPNCPGQER
jgi:pimeloyl-ACP methyl ester carboxylesterase